VLLILVTYVTANTLVWVGGQSRFKVSNRDVLQCFATFDHVNGNSFEITYVWILQTHFTIDQLRNGINTAVIWNILGMILENAFTYPGTRGVFFSLGANPRRRVAKRRANSSTFLAAGEREDLWHPGLLSPVLFRRFWTNTPLVNHLGKCPFIYITKRRVKLKH